MIKLIKLENKYKKQFNEMMEEWLESNETIIPYALTKIDYKYFDIFINQVEQIETNRVKVPSYLYFCLDSKENKLIGAVTIRQYLSVDLMLRGGHIAIGVRPTERNKGYGTKMIKLAIEKCKELDIDKVLLVCDKNNIFSAKAILKNNGKLENEIKVENQIIQRYWIES